jgi:hypothetical protein
MELSAAASAGVRNAEPSAVNASSSVLSTVRMAEPRLRWDRLVPVCRATSPRRQLLITIVPFRVACDDRFVVVAVIEYRFGPFRRGQPLPSPFPRDRLSMTSAMTAIAGNPKGKIMINVLTGPCHAGLRLLASLLFTVSALLALPQSANAAAGSDRLHPDETLSSGAAIASAAGTLRMQSDGNLVLYANQNVPIWASNTDTPGAYAVMQADGNLVLYQPRGSDRTAVWSSGTPGRGRSTLVMQSDGNLVIYGPSGPTWSTNS